MSNNGEWAIERTVQIAKGLRARMTAGPGGFTCEWDPATPRGLTKAQIGRYRRARDQLLHEVGERLGGSVLVLEV